MEALRDWVDGSGSSRDPPERRKLLADLAFAKHELRDSWQGTMRKYLLERGAGRTLRVLLLIDARQSLKASDRGAPLPLASHGKHRAAPDKDGDIRQDYARVVGGPP